MDQPGSASLLFCTPGSVVSADPDPGIFLDPVFTHVSDMDPVNINPDLQSVRIHIRLIYRIRVLLAGRINPDLLICFFALRELQSVRFRIRVFSRIRFLLICRIWILINPDLYYFEFWALQLVQIRLISRIRVLLAGRIRIKGSRKKSYFS